MGYGYSGSWILESEKNFAAEKMRTSENLEFCFKINISPRNLDWKNALYFEVGSYRGPQMRKFVSFLAMSPLKIQESLAIVTQFDQLQEILGCAYGSIKGDYERLHCPSS